MKGLMDSKNAALFAAGAVLMAVSFSVTAATCAALQYEELKDMNAEELTKEFCSAEASAVDSWAESIEMRLTKGGFDEAAAQALSSEGDQCHNQAERIKRVLGRKGIDTSGMRYDVTCKGKKL